MVWQVITAIACGLLVGDCIGICIRQIVVRIGLGERVNKKDLIGTPKRVMNTYRNLVKKDLMALVVELLLAILLAVILIGHNRGNGDVAILQVSVIVPALIMMLIRAIKLSNRLYIINTLTYVILLGIKYGKLTRYIAATEMNSKQLDKQVGICDNSIENIYTLIDKIKNKEDYDQSPELHDNIEKARGDIEKLGDMLGL